MVENKKHNKIQDKTPERSDCKTVCPYFSPSKGWRKHFLPEFYPNTGCSRNTMDTTLLFVLFFSHVINKPEPFRKRHSSLFTLHIPAVIIINRTIPNINTNSQIYYKESKEEFEIFLCGSSVNQYIDCYVLFFFKRNSSCHRLLPTFGNHIKIIERFIHFCRLGTRIVPVEQVFCVTPQKLPLTASFWLIIQMGYWSAITNIIMNAPWFFSLDRKLAGHYSFPKRTPAAMSTVQLPSSSRHSSSLRLSFLSALALGL